MTKTVEEYLQALKAELEGSDSATIQDALADAGEHLRTALESMREIDPNLNEAATLEQIIDQYGTPQETADAYREVERRTFPGYAPATAKKPASPLGRFFSIYADPRAWGGLFYMLIAFVTGVIYFSWAITGLTLSISLSLFIFGLPLALLFLLSIRAIAWLEGRLVEALLGERMPRRPLFAPQDVKLVERIKHLVLDKHTWFSLIYMLLQFALGTTYFVALVTVIGFTLTGIAIPVRLLLEYLGMPAIQFAPGLYYYLPEWAYPLVALAGILLWTLTMHAVKLIGQLHGRYAKALLVTR